MGDKVDHERFPRLIWRATWMYRRSACSRSFSGPGGRGLLHSGHSCWRPRLRRSSTHVLQNSWLHGSFTGSSGDSRQIAQINVPALSKCFSEFSSQLVVFFNRASWACSAAVWSNARHSCLWPPFFQCSTWHSLEQYHLTRQPLHRLSAFLDSHNAQKLVTSLPFFFLSVVFLSIFRCVCCKCPATRTNELLSGGREIRKSTSTNNILLVTANRVTNN